MINYNLCTYLGTYVATRHVFAKPPECHILASYQMWFGQKLLKNAKNNSKIVKIWWFLWNPLLVAPKSTTSVFFGIFDQFLAKNWSKTPKTGSCEFWHYQIGFSQKSPNLDYFSVIFGVFEQFLAKPHLVACQNRTFWRFGKNMSVCDNF